MKISKAFKTAFFLFVAVMMTSAAWSQDKEKPASPPMTAEGTINGANITINYSSPGVKGRTIWGALVPYNKVWRAGANDATTLETDKDLMIEGKKLPAGKYSFFLIPREEGPTTVIFNTVAKQWGAYDYDESKDALRVDVEAELKDDITERLEYRIEDDAIVVEWEKAVLPISVE
ncbi:DUF2911 domain-containing protein [Membranihabitans maritimus]|uniref:DUF2911 domain-containing protein n=1 Tax=Membranihabitans maritimus TaxID=2904244 RepID=UPI001F28C744|nr:DUF2911 domain-containing protein [Membranihabitans maritimus]